MTTPYTPPVDQLLKLGRPEGPWLDYPAMGLSLADVPELIRLMQDDNLRLMEYLEGSPDDEDLTEWYAGIHAWRALGQLKAEEAVPAILEIFYQIDEEENDWLDGDAPEIFRQIGPVAIPPLRAYLLDEENSIYSRGTAADALKSIALRHPETRADCVSAIAQSLENYSNQGESLNAFLIWDLTELKAVEHIDLIEQAFAENCVDIMVAGDVEDIKIELGLLTERITPTKRPFLFGESDFFEPQSRVSQPPKQSTAKKEKNKRKQEKKSRKKNRKKK
jgi:hypothetical protein